MFLLGYSYSKVTKILCIYVNDVEILSEYRLSGVICSNFEELNTTSSKYNEPWYEKGYIQSAVTTYPDTS